MKKLDHSQRVQKAQVSISKSTAKSKKKWTPKQKKIATLISSSVLALAATSTVIALAAIEAKKDRRSSYPIIAGSVEASDFIYKDNAKPSIKTEKIGAQIVSHAKMGPVNFVSNYSRMMNEEKLKDWLNWFYHDVSWGPEIATLSNISFLAGVQAENGQVTLGYHTTSRDSSTVVLSPDVNMSLVTSLHLNQSLAFEMTKNANLMSKIFPGLTGPMAYRDLVAKKYQNPNTSAFVSFNSTLGNYMLASGWTSPYISYNGALPFNAILAPAQKFTQLVEGASAPTTFFRFMDFYKNACQHWNDKDASNNRILTLDDKIKFFKKIGWDFTSRSEWSLLIDAKGYASFTGPQKVALNTKLDDLFKYLIDTPLFENLISQKLYNAQIILSDAEKTNKDWIGFKSFFKENAETISFASVLNDPQKAGLKYHLNTIDQLLQFSNDEKEIIRALEETAGITNANQYTDDDKKRAAIMAVAHHLFELNGMYSQVPGKFSVGRQLAFEIYKDLMTKHGSELDAVANGRYIWNFVNPNGAFYKTHSGLTTAEINRLKTLRSNAGNTLMNLSKHLDAKYHSGKIYNGHRVPGIPVYKENDTVYDTLVRRSSQDVMYTVSHEYGHHTTMFHAQDISAYNGLSSVGPNKDATEASHPSIVTNSEVLARPDLGAMSSGSKYGIFRDAFSDSKYMQDVMDRGSDGDSRTDVSVQMYRDRFNIDFVDSIETREVNILESGIENFDFGRPHRIQPIYFGQSNFGFGSIDIAEKYSKDVMRMFMKQKNIKEAIHREDLPMPSSRARAAFETLTEQEFQDIPSDNLDWDLFKQMREFPTSIDGNHGWYDGSIHPDGTTVNVGGKDYYILRNGGQPLDLKNFIYSSIVMPSHFYESEKITYSREKTPAWPLLAEISMDIDLGKESAVASRWVKSDLDILSGAADVFYKKVSTSVSPTGWANITGNPVEDNKKIKAAIETYKTKHYDDYVRLLSILQQSGIEAKAWNSAFEATNPRGYFEEPNRYGLSWFQFYQKARENTPVGTTPKTIEQFLDEFLTSTNISPVTKNVIDWQGATVSAKAWEIKAPTALLDNPQYHSGTYGDYLWNFIKGAGEELRDASLATDTIVPDSYIAGDPTNGNDITFNGEAFTRRMYEDAGKTTKAFFDGLFSRQALHGGAAYDNYITLPGESEKRLNMEYGEKIADKFLVWHVFFKTLRSFASSASSYENFAVLLKQTQANAFEVEYNGNKYKIRLDPKFVDDVIEKHFDKTATNTDAAGAIFSMNEDEKSVSAVIYTFNSAQDKIDYKTVFNTVSQGSTPPGSFARYSSYYSETLTRALQQTGFTQFPELSPTLGAYLDGDRTRFKSYRVSIYNNDIVTDSAGHQTLDQTLTTTGHRIVNMWEKFFSMDKELSYIVRNHQSGLYSFVGHSSAKNKYKSLVFTDLQGNIITQTKMIYGVSNHHYYKNFATPDSRVSLEDEFHRYSWMTEFAPLGDWKNTLLKSGDYKIKFWEDKNNNNAIDAGELVSLLNKQTTGNGQLNVNGKADAIAKVVGNPDHPTEFRKREELDAEFIFRISEILI